MILLFELAIYAFSIIYLLGTNGGTIPDAINHLQAAAEVTQLANLGKEYSSLCQDTQYKCLDVATKTTITSGAAPTEAGYVPIVLTPPVGAGAAYDVASSQNPTNSASFTIEPYSTVQVDGSLIMNVKLVTVTANAGSAPTVALTAAGPQKGTSYTLAYDPCLDGVVAETAATPVSSCP